MQRLEFQVDGDRLVGDLHVPVAKPRRPPLVVLAHGLSSSRVEWYGVPAAIARAGYATFTFDFRGHGESEGERGVQSLARARADLTAAIGIASAESKADPSRVALGAHSLGATLAIGALPDLPVRSLIALAPPDRLRSEMGFAEAAGYRALHALNRPLLLVHGRGLRVPYKVDYARLYEDPAAVQRARADDFLQHTIPIKNYTSLMGELHGTAWAARIKVPTLVVLASRDRVVKNASSRAVFEALGGPKQLVEIQRSGHSMPGDHRWEELVDHMTSFLGTHLRGARA